MNHDIYFPQADAAVECMELRGAARKLSQWAKAIEREAVNATVPENPPQAR